MVAPFTPKQVEILLGDVADSSPALSESMVERVARAIFRSRYSDIGHQDYWPDRLDELVNGPPFDADGYREMARAGIKEIRAMFVDEAESSPFMADRDALFAAVETIDEALK